MVDVSVIVATYGDPEWTKQAERATASVPAGVELIVRHEPGGTLAGVRNEAARHASRDWLCFLDADDELAPGYLDAMTRGALRALQVAPGPFLLVPAVQWVYENGRRDLPQVLNRGKPLYEINRAVIGTLVPRPLFLELGGFRELPALEDWEAFLRCERAGALLIDVPDAVYRAYLRGGSRNADQSLYWEIRREYEPAA